MNLALLGRDIDNYAFFTMEMAVGGYKAL